VRIPANASKAIFYVLIIVFIVVAAQLGESGTRMSGDIIRNVECVEAVHTDQ